MGLTDGPVPLALTAHLDADRLEVRKAAIAALVAFDDRAVVTLLLARLQVESDDALLAQLLYELGKRDSKQAVEAALARLSSPPSDDVRARAAAIVWSAGQAAERQRGERLLLAMVSATEQQRLAAARALPLLCDMDAADKDH
jgi:HEAT repeat protein